MNIKNVRDEISTKKNKSMNFKYNGTRGFSEEFTGIITQTFDSVFLIRTVEDNRIRSFSYSDVLIGNLIINECQIL